MKNNDKTYLKNLELDSDKVEAERIKKYGESKYQDFNEWWVGKEPFGFDNLDTFNGIEKLLDKREKQIGEMREDIISFIHMCEFFDFKNGNTDPSGSIDEGEVLASEFLSKMYEKYVEEENKIKDVSILKYGEEFDEGFRVAEDCEINIPEQWKKKE